MSERERSWSVMGRRKRFTVTVNEKGQWHCSGSHPGTLAGNCKHIKHMRRLLRRGWLPCQRETGTPSPVAQ